MTNLVAESERLQTHAGSIQAPVRIIRRGADGQIRITFLPTIGEAGAFDCRLFRKSPNVEDCDEEYGPTPAGFCIPREQGREFLQSLAELLRELEG